MTTEQKEGQPKVNEGAEQGAVEQQSAEQSQEPQAISQELVEQHPAYRTLMSDRDKTKNQFEELSSRFSEMETKLQQQQAEREEQEFLNNLAEDSPELLRRYKDVSKKARDLEGILKQVTPLAYRQRAVEVASEFKLPNTPEILSILEGTSNLQQMRTFADSLAKAIPSQAAPTPTPAPLPQSGQQKPAEAPGAFSHKPDAGYSSGNMSSINDIRESYINGDISHDEYARQLRSAGKEP